MTTTSTRNTNAAEVRSAQPKRRWPYIVALVTAVAVALMAVTLALGDGEQARDLTTGFDYNDDATPAFVKTEEPVTGLYFGHSDELWPATDITSGFDTEDDTTPGIVRRGGPIARLYFGYSPELNSDH